MALTYATWGPAPRQSLKQASVQLGPLGILSSLFPRGFILTRAPLPQEKKKSLQLLCNVVSIPGGRAYQSGGDPVPSLQLTFYLCYSLAQEEGEDSTSVISKRVHSALEHSELPGKQGLPEPERVWAEERLQPARPYAEED